jgi:hypothetical protein
MFCSHYETEFLSNGQAQYVINVSHVNQNKTIRGSVTKQKSVVKGLHNESKCFAVIMKQSSLVMDTHNM